MNFDPILDRQLIDFQRETDRIRQSKIPIYKSKLFRFLTPRMQRATLAAGKLSRMLIVIQHVYGYDELSPDSIRSENPIWNAELKNQWNHKFNIEDANFHKQWLKLEKITTDSMESVLAVSLLATVKRFHLRFDLRDFLFTNCFVPRGDVVNRSLFIQKVLNKMKESRLNYVLRGSYLPIIIYQNGDKHATTVLMMPKVVQKTGHWMRWVKQETLEWHIVLINSNSDDLFVNRVAIPLEACKRYKIWVESGQQFSETIHTKSYCWENIQKNYGTCAYWSIFIALFILKDYNKFDAISGGAGAGKKDEGTDIVTRFCKKLSEKTKNPETIYRFHGYIQDMRFAAHTLLADVVDNWKIKSGRRFRSDDRRFTSNDRRFESNDMKIQTSDATGLQMMADEMPSTTEFFQELLWGPEQGTVSLLIAIMNHVFYDLSRYESDDLDLTDLTDLTGLTGPVIKKTHDIVKQDKTEPADTKFDEKSIITSPRADAKRWSEKMQMALWENTKHQTFPMMDVLYKLFELVKSGEMTLDEKTAADVKTDFQKMFDRFFIFFDDFEEFREWLKIWFFERNKADRIALRKQQRNLLLEISRNTSGADELSQQLSVIQDKLEKQIIEIDKKIEEFLLFTIQIM